MDSHFNFEEAKKLAIEAAQTYLDMGGSKSFFNSHEVFGKRKAEKLIETLGSSFIDKPTMIIIFSSIFGRQSDGMFGVSFGRSNLLATLIANKWFPENAESKVFSSDLLKTIPIKDQPKIKTRKLLQQIMDKEYKFESERLSKLTERFNLENGKFFFYSRGVEKLKAERRVDFKKEEKKALNYYRSAKNGDVKSQMGLAFFYYDGTVVEKDLKEAVRLYDLAAKQGDSSAQYCLATFYEKGDGVVKDEKEAARLYALAAEKGDSSAQYRLAILYETGRGVEKDLKEAIRLYDLAAKQGDSYAQWCLATFYETGDGVVKDEKEAARLYGLAAEKKSSFAQYDLARLYETGCGVVKDEKEAVRLYGLAAESGYLRAQSRLALAYDKGGLKITKDMKKAIYFYEMAAAKGDVDAQSALGWIYKLGRGVDKDEEKASHYFHLVADQIQTEDGSITFSELTQMIDYESEFFIPEHWPLPTDQTGYCCGLYALANAINYGCIGSEDVVPTLYARKEGNKSSEPSVRFRAKQLGVTSFGGMHDVNGFTKITDSYGIKDCKVIKTEPEKKAYIQTFCNRLKKEKILIAACSLKRKNSFPGNADPLGTHWATIFGFFHSKKDGKCYFLVVQYGKYFLWDAEKLFESNNLPEVIPDKQRFYYKEKNDGVKKEYLVVFSELPPDVIPRECSANLDNFSRTAFEVPNKTNTIPDNKKVESGAYITMKKIK